MKAVRIENENGTFKKRYELNPSQKTIGEGLFTKGKFDPKYEEFAFYGGVRSGKSFMYQFSIWHICSTNPRARVLYVRDTYEQLKTSVIPQFRDDFEMTGTFEYKITERQAIFKNGSIVYFRAFDTDGTGILSSEYDIIVFCQGEEISYAMYLLAKSRLSGQRLKKAIFMIEGNPGAGWVKERYKDRTAEQLKADNILFVDVDIEENRKNLPQGYIEMLERIYPKEWINRFLRGGWENLVDAVFSEFREAKNVCELISLEDAKRFRIFQGFDYGWIHESAIIWAFVDYDGGIFIFDEWVDNRKTPDEIAKIAKQHGDFTIVADYAIKRPESDGKSIWDILTNTPYGLNLIEANKQEMANIMLVNQLLKTDKLFISRKCTRLIKQMMNYKVKKLRLGAEGRQQDKPADMENDAIDAMLYLVSYIEKFKTPDPQEIAFKKSLAYANQKTRNKYIQYG